MISLQSEKYKEKFKHIVCENNMLNKSGKSRGKGQDSRRNSKAKPNHLGGVRVIVSHGAMGEKDERQI